MHWNIDKEFTTPANLWSIENEGSFQKFCWQNDTGFSLLLCEASLWEMLVLRVGVFGTDLSVGRCDVGNLQINKDCAISKTSTKSLLKEKWLLFRAENA